ncbi:uncharacterized protein A1O9_12208 [Exophiala aquamarina CBS 119918]|uniref:MOSC domain-containing protein n=1 Tax=Exophiala aquamarina CBS 119918 TaxID=1182545 RepID=A0A072P8I5_9EURO|nr:uncharacterized protein A1O9_12208 [Exophiala aquamarina CBS 119918]KEF51870.1 hypothetical protein A1O9_12208 [Exophiala aquamarina CBS 119918]
MEVAAVSCGIPQWIDMNGVRTRTSIIHTISDCITLESGGGINGNNTAVHDAPVYAFFTHHYEYWRQKLGVTKEIWNWGHWGENITFRTDQYMDEYNFNLGDVWKVGTEVLLQVCGARVPCFKLAWRCGQNDKWLKELADTGFSGVYLRIIKGGSIHPGDRAELIRKFNNTATIAQISQLAFDTSLETKDTLNLLVKEPDLLPMNRGGFLRRLSKIHDDELVGKNHWTGWRTFRVAKIVQHCDDIKSFYLRPLDKKPLGAYLPGQFLTVRLPNGLLRNWSVSDWPDHDDPDHYRLSIKNVGEASRWMHTRCTLQTNLFVRVPAGSFILDWSPMLPLRQVYLSAGIGITPIVSMLKAHLKHYTMRRAPAIWVHVARDECSFPWEFLEEVLESYDEELRKKHILDIFLVYTKPPGSKVDQVTEIPFKHGSESPERQAVNGDAIMKMLPASDISAPVDKAEARASIAPFDPIPNGSDLTGTPISSTASSTEGGSEESPATSSSDDSSTSKHNDFNKTGFQAKAIPPNEYLRTINGHRIDRDFLSNILSSPYYFDPLQITPIEVPGPSTSTVYICGPSSFEQDMKTHLLDIGVPDSLLRSESFSASGNVENTISSIKKSSVTFKRSGITADWSTPETDGRSTKPLTLLEFAESLGLEPDFGCRAGQCGSCRVTLANGTVTGGLQPDGSVLMCQARPASELLALEL